MLVKGKALKVMNPGMSCQEQVVWHPGRGVNPRASLVAIWLRSGAPHERPYMQEQTRPTERLVRF